MLEFTINGKVYGFKFGLGFVREINKKMTKPMEGVPGEVQEVGLQYYIGCMFDEDVLALAELLDIANKTETPRLTKKEIDAFIEDEETDIDEVFKQVRDFLESANATKKTFKPLLEMYEEEKARREAEKAKAKANV